jgi:phage-related protein
LDEITAIDNSLASTKRKIIAFLRYNVPQLGPEGLGRFRDRINDELDEWIIGDHRIFFFCDGNRVVICTSMYMKKRQKTPQNEITRAMNLRAAYLSAKRSGKLTVTDYDQEEGRP